ncbi:MAG TPA: hypothetical protein VFA75_07915 [Nevskia sp.]|jgi:hypothetical protein|nr:hypothetical protein [Nevskia sp.]
MAARKARPRGQGELRKGIAAERLIERLQQYVLGEVELSPSQVSAAKVLLDKALGNAPAEAAGEAGDLSQALSAILNAAKGNNGLAGLVRRKA